MNSYMKMAVCTLLVAGLGLFAAGCQPKKISASQAHGFCLASVSFDGGCLDPDLACDEFYAVMLREYQTAKQCREACLRAGRKMAHGTVTIGCGSVTGRGQGYCAQYCNGAYPQ